MKIDVSFAHLHAPLFFANKNWGEKLFMDGQKGKLAMSYDRDTQELYLKQGKFEAVVPSSNIVSYVPLSAGGIEPTVQVNPVTRQVGRPKAQVSGPHDHVFAGQGAGKTND